ncbi:hypothetical protein [Macrococcoides caseolyticum]|uniref:hypothetical protein n=1 Tax=Macrococcoides caseolyticum TaxID=69966 RepID=UPI0024BD4F05|nr:hypothetical protein [Macrococcus caseolyticus]MDJ1088029.1 hypothetical protein [Macrococcus caseolyticus]
MYEKMTKNYPFELFFDKRTGQEIKFNLETPWVDEDSFWEQSNTEVLLDFNGSKVIKSDYDNGFKVIFIETPDCYCIKTNWELDSMPGGNYLPRIQ